MTPEAARPDPVRGLRIGGWTVHAVETGILRLDGGSMFGSVPKPLWSRLQPPDERNRIRLAMNVLLIRAGGKAILVETGGGAKWDAKRRHIYGFSENDPLQEALAAKDIADAQIDLVINTHLHFDHAGGNTRADNGRIVPSFPNARYVVQGAELEHAMQPTERDRASYVSADWTPITEAGQWQLLSGDAQILPGVSVVGIPGHNKNIQAVIVAGGGQSLFFAADLIPTRHHLPLTWIMGYDLYPVKTLETKRKWVAEIVRRGWIVVFGHEPEHAAATLHERAGKIEFEPVSLDS